MIRDPSRAGRRQCCGVTPRRARPVYPKHTPIELFVTPRDVLGVPKSSTTAAVPSVARPARAFARTTMKITKAMRDAIADVLGYDPIDEYGASGRETIR